MPGPEDHHTNTEADAGMYDRRHHTNPASDDRPTPSDLTDNDDLEQLDPEP